MFGQRHNMSQTIHKRIFLICPSRYQFAQIWNWCVFVWQNTSGGRNNSLASDDDNDDDDDRRLEIVHIKSMTHLLCFRTAICHGEQSSPYEYASRVALHGDVKCVKCSTDFIVVYSDTSALSLPITHKPSYENNWKSHVNLNADLKFSVILNQHIKFYPLLYKILCVSKKHPGHFRFW